MLRCAANRFPPEATLLSAVHKGWQPSLHLQLLPKVRLDD